MATALAWWIKPRAASSRTFVILNKFLYSQKNDPQRLRVLRVIQIVRGNSSPDLKPGLVL